MTKKKRTQKKDGERFSLTDLHDRTGVSLGSIRNYMANDLMPPPLARSKRQGAKNYGQEHLVRLQEIAKRIKYESIEEIRSSYVEIGDLLKPLVSKLEASTGFKVKEKDINVDDIGWGKVEITKELYFIFPQESQFNERKNLRDLHRLAKIIGNELEGTQTK